MLTAILRNFLFHRNISILFVQGETTAFHKKTNFPNDEKYGFTVTLSQNEVILYLGTYLLLNHYG